MIPLLFEEKKLKIPDLNKKYANNSGNRSHYYLQKKILCQTKRWFVFSKIGFCSSTKGFEGALNAVKVLGWLKKFGPAQNILGPVKG